MGEKYKRKKKSQYNLLSAVPGEDVPSATKIQKKEPCLKDWGHKQVIVRQALHKANEAIKELKLVTEIQVQVRIQWGLTDRCKRIKWQCTYPILYPILDLIQVNIIMHIQTSYSNRILEVKTVFKRLFNIDFMFEESNRFIR